MFLAIDCSPSHGRSDQRGLVLTGYGGATCQSGSLRWGFFCPQREERRVSSFSEWIGHAESSVKSKETLEISTDECVDSQKSVQGAAHHDWPQSEGNELDMFCWSISQKGRGGTGSGGYGKLTGQVNKGQSADRTQKTSNAVHPVWGGFGQSGHSLSLSLTRNPNAIQEHRRSPTCENNGALKSLFLSLLLWIKGYSWDG